MRYLATGMSLTALHYDWHISVSALSHIIPEVCDAIIDSLKDIWLRTPQSSQEWREVAKTLEPWNYPNCIGKLCMFLNCFGISHESRQPFLFFYRLYRRKAHRDE